MGDPYFITVCGDGNREPNRGAAGTTKVRYRVAYLQNLNQGGSGYLDAAVLDQVSGPQPPVVSNVFPLNMIYVNPADGISFNVSSQAATPLTTAAFACW